MHIDSKGRHHDLNRKWYSMRDTLEIYAEGGHVVMELKSPTRQELAKLAREEAKRND